MVRPLCFGLVLTAFFFAASGRADDADVSRSAPGATRFHADASTDMVELGGGARIFAHPGASGSVQKPCWMPPESGTKAVRAALVFAREGELTVKSPADGSRPVVVKSPGRQTVLVWRGSAHVIVRGGNMRVAVDDGAAYAGAHEGWMSVSRDSPVAIERHAAPKGYRGRLAAPEIASCSDASLRIITGERAATRVCWKPQDDASGFRVEIATDEAMNDIVGVVDAGPDRSSTEIPLPPGRYHARVLALGADGIPSLPSAATFFHLVPATLPSGTIVGNDGAFVLPEDGAIRIEEAGLTAVSSGAEDLPSASAHASRQTLFAPAPKSFTLQGHGARVFRIRDASGAEGRLAVVRRTLEAHVSTSPCEPRWPSDPIDVSVTVDDPRGRVDAASERIGLQVLVDAQPVETVWTREGNVYHARISPIDGPGPWFVRVVARDSTGRAIGEHVLDIDGRTPLAARGAR